MLTPGQHLDQWRADLFATRTRTRTFSILASITIVVTLVLMVKGPTALLNALFVSVLVALGSAIYVLSKRRRSAG